MKKVVWGVLKVIPAMRKSPWCEIRAIASRSQASADAAAKRSGIPVAYGSYAALLADPEIEAVYNPLPNHLHVPLTLQALQAGKHVLCEKPISMSAAELEPLRAAIGDRLVMEAFMVRFHPQWQRVRALIAGGEIGEPRAVQVFFSYFNDDPGNIRNQADIGGGALYDIGCYAIVAGRFMFDAEPQRVIALVDRDPALRTDRTTSALLDFGAGRRLDFTVSTQCLRHQRLNVVGTRGRIEVPIPFNAPQDEAMRILIDTDGALDGSGVRSETLPPCDQYMLQGEAFSRAVRGELALPYGLDDAARNMRIIDALLRSERTGTWQAP
jgi:predicted dehydrogenase